MNDELLQRLENWPSDKPRSRLQPYREVILRWRRQGRSYRSIQQILAAECQLSISHKAILKFVKLRMRPRTLKPEAELQIERARLTAAPTPASASAPLPGKLTPEERDRQRAILKAVRQKPVVTPKEDDDFPLWDPDKPLTNKPS